MLNCDIFIHAGRFIAVLTHYVHDNIYQLLNHKSKRFPRSLLRGCSMKTIRCFWPAINFSAIIVLEKAFTATMFYEYRRFRNDGKSIL